MIGGYHFYQSVLSELFFEKNHDGFEQFESQLRATDLEPGQHFYILLRLYEHLSHKNLQQYCLRKILEADPNDTFAAYRLAEVLADLGRISEAVEILDGLDALGAKNYHRFLFHAAILKKLGMFERSLELVQKYESHVYDPDERGQELIAGLHFLQGEFASALEVLGETDYRATALAILNNSAIEAASRGDQENAIKLWAHAEKNLGAVPEKVGFPINYNLALLIARCGEPLRGAKVLDAYLKKAKIPEDHRSEAAALLQRMSVPQADFQSETHAIDFRYKVLS